MDYASVFKTVGDAKAIGGSYAPRLELGTHTVYLKKFNVKESSKGKGKIVEAEFLCADGPHAGETRGMPWFISSPGWAGQYEESRLKDFLTAVAGCIGDTSPLAEIGANLAGPAQLGRGLQLRCVVRQGAPMKNKPGQHYQDVIWSAVPQTLEDISKARAAIDADGGGVAAPAPAPVQVAQPVVQQVVQAPPAQTAAPAAQPTTGGGMTSLLASLKK